MPDAPMTLEEAEQEVHNPYWEDSREVWYVKRDAARVLLAEVERLRAIVESLSGACKIALPQMGPCACNDCREAFAKVQSALAAAGGKK